MRLVVLLLILGFPVALILAWAFEITPEGLFEEEQKAAALYAQAIALDPGFALAHAALAATLAHIIAPRRRDLSFRIGAGRDRSDCTAKRSEVTRLESDGSAAVRAGERAVALAPDSPTVAMLARDFAGAERAVQSSGSETILSKLGGLTTPKSYLLGCIALAQGDFSRAKPLLETALPNYEREMAALPLDPARHSQLALLYAYLGRADEARRAARRNSCPNRGTRSTVPCTAVY